MAEVNACNTTYPTVEVRRAQLQAIIKKVANGFVLEIGCSTFVAKTWTEAVTGLEEYWSDPEAARTKYTEM